MNTVADRILDSLRQRPNQTYSDIARNIAAPAPSVRRTVRQLEDRGRVWCNLSNSPLTWAVTS